MLVSHTPWPEARAFPARDGLRAGVREAPVRDATRRRAGAPSPGRCGPLHEPGDAVALQRLFGNLVDNALKYGGAARVRIREQDRQAVVEIEDDGPGLPSAELARVFEPFYRHEPSRNRETGGIGLGLAVVRSIARAHGGDVTLHNRPEGGAELVLSLPQAQTP